MNNFYFLNLDIPLFKEGITINDLPKTYLTVLDKEKIINEKIFDFFNSLNLKIKFVESFFKTPTAPQNIHIDAVGGDYTKLNWVFGGGESQMTWYKPKTNLTKEVSISPTGTRFLRFAESEVEETDRTSIMYPTLIQVGVPHDVINVTENRHCISFLFQNQDNKALTMQESVEIFKDYIIGSE